MAKRGQSKTAASAAAPAATPTYPVLIDLPTQVAKKTPRVESTRPVHDTPIPLPALSAESPKTSPQLPDAAPSPLRTEPEPPMLFEVAWEVCWQLGGIYTVLRTKAPTMIERWGNRYFLIGPYNPRTAAVEFEEQPSEGPVRAALDRLRDQGIACHFGRWLIPGRPRVILLDHHGRYSRLGEDQYYLWRDHGINTQHSDGEVNDVVAFGFTVAEFFKQLAAVAPGQTILGHFHEWMGGVAVPRIAHEKTPVTTVFTTHATLLGRYLASDSANFYQHLPYFNADAEADKYRILPRHQIEKAAAHASTVFTTVSQVTSFEAEKLLGRTPDAILPNGLNIRKFAAMHEFQNLHQQFKAKIHQFVMGHFFPSYTFDLDRTVYFFTSGRYEYRNKGIDLFIESLARLNDRLKRVKDPPTIVAFIITRASVKNISVGTLQSQMQLADMRHLCAELEGQMGSRLFQSAASGRLVTFNELINEEAWVRLKRAIHAAKRTYQPPIVTHDLTDDHNDPILQHLRHRKLFNAADDPVKVVFHPEFVTATSPLIGLDYEQFVRGCHLGIFPSYYEPWGYTPMEAIALGVPAVTTDLSGFGAYVQKEIPNYPEQGIVVLERRHAGFEESVEQLVDQMYRFTQLTRRNRIELRNKVERLGERFDWSQLARHYHDAHDLAITRTGGVRMGRMEVRMV